VVDVDGSASKTTHMQIASRTCLVVACVLSSPAVAQDGLVATPKDGSDVEAEVRVDDRTPPPEQDEALGLFVGSWRCSGTSFTDAGADVPTSVTLSAKRELGGRWLVVRTELKAKAKGASPITSQEIWGASRSRGLVRNGATSQGGFIDATSTGWAGDRFAWTGTSFQDGKPAKEKLAVIKKSNKEFNLELSLGVDELRVIFEGTCTR
jgi:hypothetical protein